jgi:hypothetical protein
VPALAQSVTTQNLSYTFTNSDTFQSVSSMTVLADKGYKLEQILSDSTLPFIAYNDTLKPFENAVYWLKAVIHNPFSYDEKVMLGCFPWIDFTVFYFDYNENKWLSKRNGFGVSSYQRAWGNVPIVLKSNTSSVFYFKTNVSALQKFKYTIRCGVSVRKAKIAEERAQFLDLTTVATIFVVLMFFLFNAYIFYVFRDKTYLYYLVTQIGGILYILTTNYYLNLLLPVRFNRFDLNAYNYFWFSDLNDFVNHLSMIIVFIGFTQLTSIYLNTRKILPKHDKILQYLLYAFIAVVVIFDLITIANVKYMNPLTSNITNVMTVALMVMIFYIAFLSYQKQYKPAKYFLFFNAIPLLIILILAIYYLFFATMQRGNMPQLANIAVISQAFCLAVALGKRFLLIKDELKQKELEAQELAAQNERIAAENLLHKTELNDYTQLLLEKTEAFEKLKTKFEKQNMTTSHQDLLEHISQANIITEEQWRSFKYKFENVHTDFFNRIQVRIPSVTEAEKRFLALTKLEMSNNEIASILGISPESVTKTRYRLKKKLDEVDLDVLVERL